MVILQLFWDLEHRLEDINTIYSCNTKFLFDFFNCPEDLCSIALGIIDEMAIAGSQEAKIPEKVVR